MAGNGKKEWTPTVKQQKFINAYEGNATKAALEAGYSKKTAKSQGQRLLTNVDIQKALEKRGEEEKTALIADRTERAEILSNILRNNRAIEIDKPVQGCDTVRDEENGDYKFVILDSANKDVIKAADTLNKMDGLYVQKHQVTDKDGEPIDFNIQVTYVKPKKEEAN